MTPFRHHSIKLRSILKLKSRAPKPLASGLVTSSLVTAGWRQPCHRWWPPGTPSPTGIVSPQMPSLVEEGPRRSHPVPLCTRARRAHNCELTLGPTTAQSHSRVPGVTRPAPHHLLRSLLPHRISSLSRPCRNRTRQKKSPTVIQTLWGVSHTLTRTQFSDFTGCCECSYLHQKKKKSLMLGLTGLCKKVILSL